MNIQCHNCGATLEVTEGSSHLTVSCHRCGQPNEQPAPSAAGVRTAPRSRPPRQAILVLAGIGAVTLVMLLSVVIHLSTSGSSPAALEVASSSSSTPVAAPAPALPLRSGARRRVVPSAAPSASAGSDPLELPSCKEAQQRYIDQGKFRDEPGKPLGARAFRRVLNTGRYLTPCNVPTSMGVEVCVAIQRGRAVGVTVDTTPRDPSRQACIAKQVSRLRFPAGPGLDIARTTFAPAE